MKEELHKQFFYAFPCSFQRFNDLYGYESEPAPLYEVAQEHLFNVMAHPVGIEKEQYLEKLVMLRKDGRWGADAVSYLQSILHQEVVTYPEQVTILLLELDKAEVMSFWRFFYDGPHPSQLQAIFDSIYLVYKEQNPKLAEWMKASYEDLLLHEERGGH